MFVCFGTKDDRVGQDYLGDITGIEMTREGGALRGAPREGGRGQQELGGPRGAGGPWPWHRGVL